MKKMASAAAFLLIAGVITACSGQSAPETTAAETAAQTQAETAQESAEETAAEETAEEAAAPEFKSYKSEDGWSVRYNPELIKVQEGDEEVQFVYTGESAGSCFTSISVVPDAQPQEVLGRRTQGLDAETLDNLIREEGYFAGDHWAFFEMTPAPAEDEKDPIHEQWIAAEYNGGVLLADTVVHYTGDDGKDMRMSDALAEVLDSMEFENYEPQVMYEYVPGTYELTETGKGQAEKLAGEDVPVSIALKEDHTGTVDGEEDIPVFWYSWKLVGESSDYSHEYTIEGENLYLQMGEEWVEYQKKAE